MRNVVLYHLQSLDGVGEEPSDWMSDGGPEIFENLGAVIETQDDILLGRGTYDYWVGYWPSSNVEPFASFINSTPKHVFTSSDSGRGVGQLDGRRHAGRRVRRAAQAGRRRGHRHPRQH